jgi:site-specific recombinase XerD
MYADYDAEIRAELADELIEPQWNYALKPPAVLARDDVRLLVAAPRKEQHSLLLRVLYATGMRANEAGTFKWCDVSWAENTIFVRDGKDDKDRVVCADAETLRLLQAWRTDQPLSAEVFGVETMTTWNIMRRYSEATGLLAKYDALNLRLSPHTFATHCYENGMALDTLQTLLGHVFLETTRIYVHISAAQAAAEYHCTHELAKGSS